MDPIAIVVTALVAGAAAGVSGAASSAVQDAYTGLCEVVRNRLGSGRGGHGRPAEIVDAYRSDPVGQHDRMVAALTTAGADQDRALAEAALRVLALTFPGSADTVARYAVDLRDARGVYVGDHGTQHNTFS
ncbi:hypothetical protein [Plantactinospora endophytica]|uniref:Uncharacterized protein n=1 Tax=Plantactinospora endophytica TaxID=673535 RepID=A0ABQ4EEP2_9ACTN|nr:hypothetical protein [Plantactinospora endophytica]GIG92716.1 hypothetical protein Pen02_76520 [Plantactinospora endophytica]